MDKPKPGIFSRIFRIEKKGLFAIFEDLRHHHFMAISALLMSLSVCIFYFNGLRRSGNEINIIFLIVSCAIALFVTIFVLYLRDKSDNFVPSISDYFESLLPLASVALLFTMVYVIFNLILSGVLLSLFEVIFMLCVSTAIETLMLHVRSRQW